MKHSLWPADFSFYIPKTFFKQHLFLLPFSVLKEETLKNTILSWISSYVCPPWSEKYPKIMFKTPFSSVWVLNHQMWGLCLCFVWFQSCFLVTFCEFPLVAPASGFQLCLCWGCLLQGHDTCCSFPQPAPPHHLLTGHLVVTVFGLWHLSAPKNYWNQTFAWSFSEIPSY